MTTQQQRILDAIPYGQENAITNKRLAWKTGIKDTRIVRQEIETIIDEDIAPICASCNGNMGYFRPVSGDEIDKYTDSLLRRSNKIYKRRFHLCTMKKRDFPRPWEEQKEMGVG